MHENERNEEELELLYQRAVAGEESAFAELFGRHKDFLMQAVSIRMDSELRQQMKPADIVAEAYSEAVREFAEYQLRRLLPFRLWLREIAIKQLQMQIRLHRRSTQRDPGEEGELPEESVFAIVERFFAIEPQAQKQPEPPALNRKIRTVLQTLSGIDQEILLLRNVEKLSNRESARVLGIEPIVAMRFYVNALKHLKQAMTEITDSGEEEDL